MASKDSEGKNRISVRAEEVQVSPKHEDDPQLEMGRMNSLDENDSEHPYNFPAWRKWLMVLAVSLMYTNSYFACLSIVPAAPEVVRDFGVDSTLYRTLLVSIWELGEGVGPFLVAPLSERYGRRPIFHIGNLLAVICSVAGALSVNISMLVAFRFLNGMVLTTLTLGPTIIADLFKPEQRGTAMAVGTGLNLIGLFLGPVAGGLVTQARGWRWTCWVNTITIGSVALFASLVMRETYAVKILNKKNRRLGGTKGDKNPESGQRPRITVATLIRRFTTPIQMLCHSRRVFLVSFYTAFSYGMVYTIMTMLAPVLEDKYGFSQGVVGVPFLAIAIGQVLAMLFYGFTSDRYVRYRREKEGSLKPEHRLIHMVLGAMIYPCGILIWGWTMGFRVQYIVPLIGAALIGFSMMLTMLPVQNYLADAFEDRRASAIGAGVILRAFFGAVFPLCGPPLFKKLGLGWGSTVFAGIAIICVPGVFMLWRGDHKHAKDDHERTQDLS